MSARDVRGAARAVMLGALVMASGCDDRTLPPAGQLLVHIDTDAPLVAGDSRRTDAMVTAGLFDRLRIEVIAPDGAVACETCRRDFVITTDDLEKGLTFGVKLPLGDATYRLRARLFPFDGLVGDRPRDDATIDGLFALPAHGADGVLEVTAMLLFDAVGIPADLESGGAEVVRGVAPRATPAVPLVRPMCTQPESDVDACVPGGTYWANGGFTTLEEPAEPRRAIVMSPFYLDRREVAVADLRRSGLAKATDPRRGAGCTYADSASENDELPVTCISAELAQAYCRARGGDLPTLAQMEYVRGRLEGRPYVWGVEPPTCVDAVYARTGGCGGLGAGPQKAGTGQRDRLVVPGGVLVDLAGNVSEWLVDRTTKACRVAGKKIDPVCGSGEDALGGATGGDFTTARDALLAQARFGIPGVTTNTRATPSPQLGFRCARRGSR